MFTGLIQEVGVVRLAGESLSVLVAATEEAWQVGESVAINGCCLTVKNIAASTLSFDLSPETTARTNLGRLQPGSRVNVERAMRPIDRLGGHIVQGHVDLLGEICNIEPRENAVVVEVLVPELGAKYLVDKGSVAVNGISLTVVSPAEGRFSTWIIPHTMANTNLSDAKIGDTVNVEFDVIAKHVDRLMSAYRGDM